MEIMKKIAARSREPGGQPMPAIAFLGDSVTQGCFEVFLQEGSCQTVFDQEYAFASCVSRILRTLFPNVPVCIIDAGIGGDNAAGGLERLERDVLRFRPDLTVVGFGLNDCGRGMEYIGEYGRNMRGIFRKLKGNQSEVICMTPNMMNTYVNRDKLKEPELIRIAEYSRQIQAEGILDAYVEEEKKAARECGVYLCDIYEKWKSMYRYGADITGLLANHINHPAREMNWLSAYSLVEIMFQE